MDPEGTDVTRAEPSVDHRGFRPVPALAVWAVWRLTHAVVVALAGGGLVERTIADDGAWYLNILQGGYRLPDPSYTTQQNVAFMPLVPLITEPFAWLWSPRIAAVIIANATSVAAFVAVHEAARRWWDDRGAVVVIVGMALWPYSMFLWTYYSEATFVTVVALGFVGLYERRAWMVVACAFLAPIARPTGVVFGAAVAVAGLVRERRLSAMSASAGSAAFAGLGSIIWFQHRAVGDGFAFLHVQSAWYRDVDWPWFPTLRAGRAFLDALPTIDIESAAALGTIGVGVVAVAVTARAATTHDGGRAGFAESAVYCAVLFVGTQFTALYTSQPRYALALFPLLLALRTLRRVPLALVGASATALSLFTLTVWTNGTFIG